MHFSDCRYPACVVGAGIDRDTSQTSGVRHDSECAVILQSDLNAVGELDALKRMYKAMI
jgi:hypothetical protein